MNQDNITEITHISAGLRGDKAPMRFSDGIHLAAKALRDKAKTKRVCLHCTGVRDQDWFRRGCLLLQGILLGLVWFLPLR
jgi:hypothetical protein